MNTYYALLTILPAVKGKNYSAVGLKPYDITQ